VFCHAVFASLFGEPSMICHPEKPFVFVGILPVALACLGWKTTLT
jgi:hypothetical protein